MSKMTLEEMETQITELKANYDKKDKELATFKAEAEAKIKKAEDETEKIKQKEKEKEAESGESGKERKAKFHKAMKAATEEKDETKKAALLAEAMKHYSSEEDVDKEDKEKEKKEAALEAKLTILKAEVAKPRINYLSASYKNRVDEKILQTYVANWSKMEIEQLDAEIEKVKPFVASSIKKISHEPMGFSNIEIPTPFSGSTKEDEFSASVEKLSPSELFGGKK